MKKTIFVYIIFAFLLTSFAGCGKLKDSPVFGLNRSETSAPSNVGSQSEKVEPVKQEASVKKEETKQLEPVEQVELKTVKPIPLLKLSRILEPTATPEPEAEEVKQSWFARRSDAGKMLIGAVAVLLIISALTIVNNIEEAADRERWTLHIHHEIN